MTRRTLEMDYEELRALYFKQQEALRDALEGLEEMRPYVSDYFAEKWEHDGYIERARNALNQEKL